MKLFQSRVPLTILAAICIGSALLSAQVVTFQPYIQPGDAGSFGTSDQMLVVWQTNDTAPHPEAYLVWFANNPAFYNAQKVSPIGRLVDNYLSADPATFGGLSVPTAYGAHTNYYAALKGLRYDTQIYYRVRDQVSPTASLLLFTREHGVNTFHFKFRAMKVTIPGSLTPTQFASQITRLALFIRCSMSISYPCPARPNCRAPILL